MKGTVLYWVAILSLIGVLLGKETTSGTLTGSELRLKSGRGKEVLLRPMRGGGIEVVTEHGLFQVRLSKLSTSLRLAQRGDNRSEFFVTLDSDGAIAMGLGRKREPVFFVRSDAKQTVMHLETPRGAKVVLGAGVNKGTAYLMAQGDNREPVFYLGRDEDGVGAKMDLFGRGRLWALSAKSDGAGRGVFAMKSKSGGGVTFRMTPKGTELELRRGKERGGVTIGAKSGKTPNVTTTDREGKQSILRLQKK